MLLTSSAADITVLHGKFGPTTFGPGSEYNPATIHHHNQHLELNLGEVSSSTDIINAKLTTPSSLQEIKRDPEQSLYTPSAIHSSAAFFSPQYYQGGIGCTSHYSPQQQSGYGTHFSSLSSLISPESSNYFHQQHQTPQPVRDTMSAELAAAGAVAAAAARARAVGSVEEEVFTQQRASRRQMHKICEQKRRDGLKTALDTLKKTIPGCSILSDQSQQNILLKGKTDDL